MKIRIGVAVHKPYAIPGDAMYLPVQAGRALHPALKQYTGDDTGESISEKNAGYCELTVLYWLWKNVGADAIGLCHYRRYFAGSRLGPKWGRILTAEQAERYLEKADVILPKKRNYWIETNYSQYTHAHHAKDLDLTREVIGERCPEYLDAFDRVMDRTQGHRFNMLLMRREVLKRYCAWLFDILFTLEERLDTTGYSGYDKRVYGFLGERLLDVWLESQNLRVKELPVAHLESQHWPRKIIGFLKRKFLRQT